MSRRPTFELLREKRELSVISPRTRARFTVSLRDWQGVLCSIRIHPHVKKPTDHRNPFVSAHRMMSRSRIEDWLSSLRLVQNPQVFLKDDSIRS
jgi:hypothetical protein